jgi:hypothetical protein
LTREEGGEVIDEDNNNDPPTKFNFLTFENFSFFNVTSVAK